jgi:tetratricopeptide (TPR) repeat protein
MKRAPQHPNDVWEGGIFRGPAWITGEKRSPYRGLLAVWISHETGAVFAGEVLRPEELDPERALDVLAKGVLSSPYGGYRPGRLAVTDPSLAEYLRDRVSEINIEVMQVERVEQVEAFLRLMARETVGPVSACGALDAPGVTAERMRTYADAAADFYRAGLWNHLTDIDLIRVESPVPNEELAHFTVMGALGKIRGLMFVGSAEEFQALVEDDVPEERLLSGALWGLSYGPIMDLPFPDADLWEEHGLAVADPEAYPCFLCIEDEELFSRPDDEELAFIEGLLRALAETTEDDLDGGRWTKKVRTFDGMTDVTLALPGILDAPEIDIMDQSPTVHDRWSMERTLLAIDQIFEEKEFASEQDADAYLKSQMAGKAAPEFKIRNPREKALSLFYQALEAEGRLQIKLAREALATDPDCVDAHVLLAECMPDPERRLDLYFEALKAGRRMIGEKTFKEDAGRFWSITKTRPYMRALAALAYFLRSSGLVDEAIKHYRELLHLNPNDGQGIRFMLLPLLLERGLDDEARDLIEDYDVDISASMLYGGALLAFREEGDSPSARKQLDAAIKRNPHMVKFLLGTAKTREEYPEYYQIGTKEEAVACGPDLRPAWKKTPGAVAWLKARRRDLKKAAGGSKRKSPQRSGGARPRRRSGVKKRR